MAHGKLYRSFIILQEDERGHSVSSDKPLSGYAKIEAKNDKCKIAFYAQNLKKEYKKCHMVLICSKKDTRYNIKLGDVNINEQGKAEITVDHMANNIGGTGIGYDKIVGAGLCKDISGKLMFLMCGFLNGEQPTDDWKNYNVIQIQYPEKKIEEMVEKEDKKIIKDEVKSESKIIKEKMEVQPSMEEVVQPPLEEEVEPWEQEEVVEEVQTPPVGGAQIPPMGAVQPNISGGTEEADGYDCRGLESRFDDYEMEIESHRFENFEEEELQLRGCMGEFFESVANGFEKVKGFAKEINNCKWYKVKIKDIDEMCDMKNYNKYTVVYYPMINYYPYMKNKGHFLWGLKTDKEGNVKYIVYGVPGTKAKEDQPYGGKTGFVTWVESDDDKKNGYWLMFYDFKNSMIVIPMQ